MPKAAIGRQSCAADRGGAGKRCAELAAGRACLPPGAFPISRSRYCCRSSVVEHPLGKGEVVSSILPGSTSSDIHTHLYTHQGKVPRAANPALQALPRPQRHRSRAGEDASPDNQHGPSRHDRQEQESGKDNQVHDALKHGGPTGAQRDHADQQRQRELHRLFCTEPELERLPERD
jgi:hypothetical protein